MTSEASYYKELYQPEQIDYQGSPPEKASVLLIATTSLTADDSCAPLPTDT